MELNYRPNYLRFALVFWALTVAIPLAFTAILAVTNVDLDSTATDFLPMMAASLLEGSRFAKLQKRPPEKREAWSIARRLTVVAVVVSIVWLVIFIAILHVATGAALPELETVFRTGPRWLLIFVSLMLGAIVLFFLIARYFFAFAAKTELKAEARRKERHG